MMREGFGSGGFGEGPFGGQKAPNKIIDFNHPLADGIAPSWASGWGQDQYGVFVEIEVKEVVQRMRWIPPGEFMMGSPESEQKAAGGDDWFKREGPQHQVTISRGFWLFDTAVTQALWLAVMEGENPSRFTDDDQLPVEKVSWHDCREFTLRVNEMLPGLNLTLPTEAQWEYACRALRETPFNTGNQITADQANYNGNSPYAGGEKGEYRQTTVPVKSFQPNEWGLWQMHGNVYEWCLDAMRDYSGEPQVDPVGSLDGSSRVLRGGSWSNSARYCRSACRYWNNPGFRGDFIGFRPARVQEAER